MNFFNKISRSFALAHALLYIPLITGQMPSLHTFRYKAAGVLPVYTFKGQKWAIIAREKGGSDAGTYDSFAGSADKGENDPTITAARECAEELITHMVIGKNSNDIRDYIDVHNKNTELVIADQRKKYALFITNFDKYVDDIKHNFYTALKTKLPYRYKEKDKLAFVSFKELKRASQSNCPTVQALILSYDPTKKQYMKNASIQLRPILLAVLKNYFNNKPYQTGTNPTVRFY
ncbi:MAG TPA: NUDIX hydrolase [Candidatus Babeliales bacterium]|nr:NUDIX hydrolase [Candidatus Babeliales bacterium]